VGDDYYRAANELLLRTFAEMVTVFTPLTEYELLQFKNGAPEENKGEFVSLTYTEKKGAQKVTLDLTTGKIETLIKNKYYLFHKVTKNLIGVYYHELPKPDSQFVEKTLKTEKRKLFEPVIKNAIADAMSNDEMIDSHEYRNLEQMAKESHTPEELKGLIYAVAKEKGIGHDVLLMEKATIKGLVESFNAGGKKAVYDNEAETRQKYINPFFEALGWDIHGKVNKSEVTVEEAVQVEEKKEDKS